MRNQLKKIEKVWLKDKSCPYTGEIIQENTFKESRKLRGGEISCEFDWSPYYFSIGAILKIAQFDKIS